MRSLKKAPSFFQRLSSDDGGDDEMMMKTENDVRRPGNPYNCDRK
jgi:hypothetical protein